MLGPRGKDHLEYIVCKRLTVSFLSHALELWRKQAQITNVDRADTGDKSFSVTTTIRLGSQWMLRVTLCGCYTAECLVTICNLQGRGVTLMLPVMMELMLFERKSWMF